MSMQILTVLQFIYMLAAYMGVIVILPAIVFYPFFEGRPTAVKLISYLTIGNFYVMNLVFVLELLHISNRFTLIAGVAVPACAAIGYIHWNSWAKNALTFAGEATYGMMLKTMGVRLLLSKLFQSVVKTAAEKIRNVIKKILSNPIDTIGTLMVLGMIFWQYGTNVLENYGYMASDTPVHNYWINSMCDNKIFVAGVYPFGMHNIVYFLHEVFGMKVFTLLRIFGLLQTALIHLCLLGFLRVFCKSKMAPYIGLAAYLIVDIWNKNTYSRFLCSLPQEYGMIFILPGLMYLFLFFENRKSEGRTKGLKFESTKDLTLFAMNFSMTLAVHFYDTMIAGLFCIAAAIAFINVIFKKEYFWRILVFGILSVAVAVFPMAFAYATGTPLQGSLTWGLGIMQSDNTPAVEWKIPGLHLPEEWEREMDLAAAESVESGQSSTGRVLAASPVRTDSLAAVTGDAPDAAEAKLAVWIGAFAVSLAGKSGNIAAQFNDKAFSYLSETVEGALPGAALMLIGIVLLCGIVLLVLKEGFYGRILISGSVFSLLMCAVLISKTLKIPALMDESRCSIYLCYSLALLIGLLADFILFLGLEWLGESKLKQMIPFAAVIILFLTMAGNGLIREPKRTEGLEKNGAIMCVTNILRTEKPNTFTIVSANDELRMVEEYGYFYESIELLRRNIGERTSDYTVIPTPKVFVFIEKIPGNYMESYEGSGSKVTVSSALEKVPSGAGISIYKGKKRHIVMSKLYFWAKAFEKLYENETSVYYEDDEFICYEIRQNVYRPFDFSIDYGFNNAGLAAAPTIQQ